MGVLPFELALTFYFAATIVSVTELFKESKVTSRITLLLAGAGFLIHTISIIYRYVAAGHIPITNTHEATSFFAWCIVLIFFLLQFRYRVTLLSSFIIPSGIHHFMLLSSMLPREINLLRRFFKAIEQYMVMPSTGSDSDVSMTLKNRLKGFISLESIEDKSIRANDTGIIKEERRVDSVPELQQEKDKHNAPGNDVASWVFVIGMCPAAT